MRILSIVDAYLPSPKSVPKMAHDLAVEFGRLGHDSMVLTADGAISQPLAISEEDGVRVARFRTGRIKGAGRVRRALNEMQLSRTFWQRGRGIYRAQAADLIIFYSPTIFFGALVRRLKGLWDCPAYLVLRDIFPQWALDMGLLKPGLIASYFRHQELKQYAAADIIAVQSPGNLAYFERPPLRGRYRLEVLYNWTPATEVVPSGGCHRERLGLSGKVVFFFGGNIGVGQDMDNILRLAGALRHEQSCHFLLVGEGSEVPRLRTAIATEGMTNVTLHPAVPQTEYLAMLGEFDIGLISLDRQLRTHNFPGKMLAYMTHSIPILASINPGNDLAAIIDEGEAGLVSINGDDDLLRDQALSLARDTELRKRLGANARRLLESTFSTSAAASKILHQLAAQCE